MDCHVHGFLMVHKYIYILLGGNCVKLDGFFHFFKIEGCSCFGLSKLFQEQVEEAKFKWLKSENFGMLVYLLVKYFWWNFTGRMIVVCIL